MVELAERGAYRGYGTPPANSQRSPRGGPRSSMCSRPRTSYHRIKYAHQWGPVPGGRLRQGRTRSQGGGQSSMGPGRGSRLRPWSPQAVGALIQARAPQRGKCCSSRPRWGEWLGPENPPAVGALLQTRGPQRGKHCSRNHVTIRVQTAGIDPCVQGGNQLQQLPRR